jgi:hypothetical protein
MPTRYRETGRAAREMKGSTRSAARAQVLAAGRTSMQSTRSSCGGAGRRAAGRRVGGNGTPGAVCGVAGCKDQRVIGEA